MTERTQLEATEQRYPSTQVQWLVWRELPDGSITDLERFEDWAARKESERKQNSDAQR